MPRLRLGVSAQDNRIIGIERLKIGHDLGADIFLIGQHLWVHPARARHLLGNRVTVNDDPVGQHAFGQSGVPLHRLAGQLAVALVLRIAGRGVEIPPLLDMRLFLHLVAILGQRAGHVVGHRNARRNPRAIAQLQPLDRDADAGEHNHDSPLADLHLGAGTAARNGRAIDRVVAIGQRHVVEPFVQLIGFAHQQGHIHRQLLDCCCKTCHRKCRREDASGPARHRFDDGPLHVERLGFGDQLVHRLHCPFGAFGIFQIIGRCRCLFDQRLKLLCPPVRLCGTSVKELLAGLFVLHAFLEGRHFLCALFLDEFLHLGDKSGADRCLLRCATADSVGHCTDASIFVADASHTGCFSSLARGPFSGRFFKNAYRSIGVRRVRTGRIRKLAIGLDHHLFDSFRGEGTDNGAGAQLFSIAFGFDDFCHDQADTQG